MHSGHQITYIVVTVLNPSLHFSGRKSKFAYDDQTLLLFFKNLAKGHFYEKNH